MERTFLSLLLFTGAASMALAQTVTTLRPGPTEGRDALLKSCVQCGNWDLNNYGTAQSLAAVAWTNSGGPSNIRSLLDFDLDTLPAGAQILDARLSLYHDPTSSEGEHSSLSGPNNCSIQRVVQSWDEMTVTWDGQPPSTALNQVVLPQSTSATQDYTDIDVTALVVDMIQYGGHGFLLRMETESYYRRVVFASSDHPDADLHPKLVITHQGGVGVEEASAEAFQIHPNPSSGLVIFDGVNAGTQMEVFDPIGNLIYATNPLPAGRTSIDLSDRSPGVYLVRIMEGSGRSSVQRILLQG